MDVKRGYKQTEVGMIPEDWAVRTLGEIGESLIGLTYRPADVRSDGILVLRSSNIHEGTLCFDDTVFVNTEIPDKIMAKMGDILICVRNGSRDLIGKCAQIDERARGMTFGAFMSVFRTPFYSFVYHQFQSLLIKRQIHEHLGATINQITNKSLNSFRIPLPPTKAEQEALAKALSDADAFIESLEHLVAQKRQIKQGAMRELLTGKKRLLGFKRAPADKLSDIGLIPAEWNVSAVKEMGHVEAGKALNAKGLGPQRPYLRTKNVLDGRIDLDDVLFMPMTDSEFSHFRLKHGDVLLNEGQSLELVGRCSLYQGEHPGPCAIQNQLIRFRAHSGVSAEFAEKLFRYCQNTGVFCGIATQTTSVAHLGVSRFQNLRLAWPADLAEQKAIASVLSDMDSELEEIEAKLAKARQVKQGMMQELLTGRIRLV
jgi:type I restriction enzyme S subunit